ncbi:hypothetical protein K438DRAFT_1979326 [Mycena galopus ATCC 62051]|nr:hypothetical protein K438DRAFT_1979326 [Mycena galopus ATCC 62051]
MKPPTTNARVRSTLAPLVYLVRNKGQARDVRDALRNINDARQAEAGAASPSTSTDSGPVQETSDPGPPPAEDISPEPKLPPTTGTGSTSSSTAGPDSSIVPLVQLFLAKAQAEAREQALRKGKGKADASPDLTAPEETKDPSPPAERQDPQARLAESILPALTSTRTPTTGGSMTAGLDSSIVPLVQLLVSKAQTQARDRALQYAAASQLANAPPRSSLRSDSEEARASNLKSAAQEPSTEDSGAAADLPSAAESSSFDTESAAASASAKAGPSATIPAPFRAGAPPAGFTSLPATCTVPRGAAAAQLQNETAANPDSDWAETQETETDIDTATSFPDLSCVDSELSEWDLESTTAASDSAQAEASAKAEASAEAEAAAKAAAHAALHAALSESIPAALKAALQNALDAALPPLLAQLEPKIDDLRIFARKNYNLALGDGRSVPFEAVPFPDGTMPGAESNTPTPLGNVDVIDALAPAELEEYWRRYYPGRVGEKSDLPPGGAAGGGRDADEQRARRIREVKVAIGCGPGGILPAPTPVVACTCAKEEESNDVRGEGEKSKGASKEEPMDEWRRRLYEEESTEALEKEEEPMDEWRRRLYEDHASTDGLNKGETSNKELDKEGESEGVRKEEVREPAEGLEKELSKGIDKEETLIKKVDKEDVTEGASKEEGEPAEELEELSKGVDKESKNGPRLEEESTEVLDKEEPMDEWRKRLYE